MISLSARLDSIARLLEPCALLADVCTDHGLLPVAAVQRGVAARAIAADLRQAPLVGASRTIERARVEDRVVCLQGDGILALEGHPVDAVTVAGVSGQLIVRLCEEAPGVLAGVRQIIVQPNSDAADVRAWARGHGWHLHDEQMVAEKGRFFVICSLVPGAGPDPAYALGRWTEETLGRVGPRLLARQDAVARRWCEGQRDRVRELVERGAARLAAELAEWQAICAAWEA
jgi:tRNA (adenine22-N1)-methyltransferase